MVPRSPRALAAVFAVLCLPVAAGPASAQAPDNPSVLTLLPVRQALAIGDEVTGSFTSADYSFSGQLVQAYAFEAEEGAPVTIDVLSDALDTYVYLLDPDGQEIASDDDSGGACNARISTFTSSAGRHLIIAASLTGETGAFTVRADDRQHPPASGSCGGDGFEDDALSVMNEAEPVGPIGLGDAIESELAAGDPEFGDGSRMKVYELLGSPGQTVVVDLLSDAFDALLRVVDPRGEYYMSDDDSGGACNSRMEVTLDMQPHKVVVTSIGGGAAGPFTLSVSEEWGPEAPGGCVGGASD